MSFLYKERTKEIPIKRHGCTPMPFGIKFFWFFSYKKRTKIEKKKIRDLWNDGKSGGVKTPPCFLLPARCRFAGRFPPFRLLRRHLPYEGRLLLYYPSKAPLLGAAESSAACGGYSETKQGQRSQNASAAPRRAA